MKKRAASLVIVLLLVWLHTSAVLANSCVGLPVLSFIGARFQNLLDSTSGEGGQTITAQSVSYACQAQGSTMGTYRELSVVIQYTSSIDNDASTQTALFDMECILDGGNNLAYDEVDGSFYDLDANSVDPATIDLRTDCSSCTGGTAVNDRCDG